MLWEFVFGIKNGGKYSIQWDLKGFKNFLQRNQLDALISHIYSWNETLKVSESFSVHHQVFFTLQ